MAGKTAVGVAFEGHDLLTPVVRGIRNSMDGFKRDAATGFGLGAGISVFNLAKDAIGGVVDFMGDAVGAASALSETQAKVGQVYKTTGAQVLAWGEDAAEAMGLSTQKALEAHATFGNFTQALGATEEQSMEMSGSLVQLAADLASFNNTDVEDVLVSLRSGMAGEAEPMRRLGADVSAARVEMELMEMGVAKVNGKFTESDKIMGRYRAIMEDTATAQGDFARTSDGLANTQRTLAANIEDLMADVGAAILPIATAITQVAVDAIDAVQGLIEGIGDLADMATAFLDPGRDMRTSIDKIADSLDTKAALSLRTYVIAVDLAAGGSEDLTNRLKYLAVAEVNQASLMQNMARISAESGANIDVVTESTIALTERLKVNGFMTANATDRARIFTEEIGKLYEEFGLLNPFLEDNAQATTRVTSETEKATATYLAWTRETEVGREHIRNLNAEYDVLSSIMPPLTQKMREATIATGETDIAIDKLGKSVGALGPSIKSAIDSSREGVKEAMANLRWAMENPFADEKFAAWLKERADKAMQMLALAIKQGRPEAVAEAAATRIAILEELNAIDPGAGTQEALRQRRREMGERAAGGPVSAGSTYLVGEKGPELLTMGGNGYVTPNDRISSSGGAGNVYLDGYLVGRVIDERLGRQYGTASRVTNYRRSA